MSTYLGDSRPACSKKSSVMDVWSRDNVMESVQDIMRSSGEKSDTKFEAKKKTCLTYSE